MNPKFLARAGLASLPVTAFAPLAGAAWTGYGTPWMAFPIGSVAALVGGGCAHRRAAAIRRRGVIVSEPSLNALRDACATGARDEITVDYSWSDAA